MSWVSSLAAAPAQPALFVCNELPDAMPVHLVQWDGAAWKELFVVAPPIFSSQFSTNNYLLTFSLDANKVLTENWPHL